MNQSGKSPWDAAIDALSVLSFLIGLENLSLNVSQNDLQDQTQELDAKFSTQTAAALAEIHAHLQEQDEKLNRIIKELEYAHGKKAV